MSHHDFAPSNAQASTSTNPNTITAASYHPNPRPKPVPPLIRVDVLGIKQELHDALGENGLAYWKALNGYLIGQVGRAELEGLVREWLKGDQIDLHNKLLISLLFNASIPSSQSQPPSAIRKRKRLPYSHPEYDIDENNIEPKSRVSLWYSELTSRDRGRIRRAMIKKQTQENGEKEDEGSEEPNGVEDAEWITKRKKMSSFTPRDLPPVEIPSDRLLPSSSQLTQRLSSIAKQYDLTISPDLVDDIGEFLSIGTDNHLSDILHEIISLTGKNRPGEDTIKVPPPALSPRTKRKSLVNGHKGVDIDQEDDIPDIKNEVNKYDVNSELPKPDIETLKYIMTLNGSSHPHASPIVNKLLSGQITSELEAIKPTAQPSSKLFKPSNTHVNGMPNGHNGKPNGDSKSAHHFDNSDKDGDEDDEDDFEGDQEPMIPLTGLPAMHRSEQVTKRLLESGLLKIDKPDKEDGDGGQKKSKKHNLHWKYEDPAILFKDVLG